MCISYFYFAFSLPDSIYHSPTKCLQSIFGDIPKFSILSTPLERDWKLNVTVICIYSQFGNPWLTFDHLTFHLQRKVPLRPHAVLVTVWYISYSRLAKLYFLIWQFELLRKILLEVKIKSGGYCRALVVASSREIRWGHRTLQISRYQIYLLLQSDFSKVLTNDLIVSDIKCAINSKVCIIKCRLMVHVCVTKSLCGCVILECGSWWLANEANTYNSIIRLKIEITRIEQTQKVQPSSDIDRLS